MTAPSDYLLPLRRAVIRHLRAHAPLTALVGQRIYEETPPNVVRPFVRYGAVIATAYEATGIEGSDADLTLHAHDEGPDNDRVHAVMDAIRSGLDEAELEVTGGELLWIAWSGTQLLGERSGTGTKQYRHGIVTFTSAVGNLET